MNKQVSKTLFKAHALEIMREVEATGMDVVITAHGKKALTLSSYKDPSASPLDTLNESVAHYDAPYDPVAEDDWDMS